MKNPLDLVTSGKTTRFMENICHMYSQLKTKIICHQTEQRPVMDESLSRAENLVIAAVNISCKIKSFYQYVCL